MRKEKCNQIYNHQRPFVIGVLLFAFSFLAQIESHAQTFSVSFPIGSMVYQNSELPLTVVIEGVKCENTVIKCHIGIVTMVEACTYIYRSKTFGVDTVEVFIRKGDKLHRIGQQEFEIKPRPLPEANISGLKGGVIQKGVLQAQQGVGGQFFVAGNHWESCTIESFTLLVLRNGRLEASIRNEGNLFTNETKVALKQVKPGDKVLVTDIKGCSQFGRGDLKPLEFSIK